MTLIIQADERTISRLTLVTLALLEDDAPDDSVAFEICRREVLRAAIERGLLDIERSITVGPDPETSMKSATATRETVGDDASRGRGNIGGRSSENRESL